MKTTMPPQLSPLLSYIQRNWLPLAFSVCVLVGLYVASQPSRVSDLVASQIAGRFSFDRRPLPIVSAATPQSIREVHPSLSHFAAWISFVGGAVSLGDLDGDGLPNDLAYVDPRFDVVTLCPAPGSGDRFEPFLLNPTAVEFDTDSTAPMGTRLGDFNEDGLADLLVYYWGRSPLLFLQEPSVGGSLSLDSFQQVELVSPPEVWHTSCATQADLDGDGHFDLVIGNYNPDGARTLDANDTSQAEVMMGSWGRATNGGTARLMLRQAKQNYPLFVEAKNVLNDRVARGWTFACGAADFDGDMLPEIYLANDFGADCFLHNRSTPGRLEFVELPGQRSLTTPRSMVVGLDTFNGMGVDFHDVNVDGHLDMMISNITSDYGLHQSNLVFVNTGEVGAMQRGVAPFENQSEQLGLSRGGWAWDTKFGDFDNDSVAEVLQATGFFKGTVNRWPELHEMALANEELAIRPELYPILREGDDVSGHQHNPFFVMHQGRYYDIAHQLADSGLDETMLSRGMAMADVDGDGKLDFAYGNHFEDSYFYHNRSAGNHKFLGLHLRIPIGSSPTAGVAIRPGHPTSDTPSIAAVGAYVQIQFGSQRGQLGPPSQRKLIGQVDGGSGHSGQRSPNLHFGLGELPDGDSITVLIRWRSLRGELNTVTLDDVQPGWHTVMLSESTTGDMQ